MTQLDPIVQTLVDRLPPADAGFTTGDRERWVAAMDAALQFLYPPEWSEDACRKAREARGSAKEAAAAYFPTITAPSGGVTIAGPLHEPVLLLPDPVVAERHVLATLDEYARAAQPKEAPPSTPFADAVDGATSPVPGGATTTGADVADDTSPRPPAGPDSEPSKPGSVDPAPSTPSPSTARSATARRHFTADQRGAILRRVVREGKQAVADDTDIHPATIDRWMRDMPLAVETFRRELEAEQEAGPTLAEMEAEQATPVPPKPDKPAVQWPTAPIERRPVDHAAVLRAQADQV